MTILPGQDPATAPEFNRHAKPPRQSRTLVILLVVMIAVAGIGGGAWWLTKSKPAAASSAPAASRLAPPRPVGIVAQADRVFTALQVLEPLWQRTGRTHIDASKDAAAAMGPAVARCAGVSPIASTNVASPDYARGMEKLSGTVSFFGSPALAARDWRNTTSPRALVCIRRGLSALLASAVGHARLSHVRFTRIALPASIKAPALGLHMAMDISSANRTVPLAVDLFAMQVGRTEVAVEVGGVAGPDVLLPLRSAFVAVAARASRLLSR
jgi:uncharacterized membrane protein